MRDPFTGGIEVIEGWMGYSQSGYVRCSGLAVSFVVWALYLLASGVGASWDLVDLQRALEYS